MQEVQFDVSAGKCISESERAFIEAEVERLAARTAKRHGYDPESFPERYAGLKAVYRNQYGRIISVRTPHAAENLTCYIGQLGRIDGNAYHGFDVTFADGKYMDIIHFNWVKIAASPSN